MASIPPNTSSDERIPRDNIANPLVKAMDPQLENRTKSNDAQPEFVSVKTRSVKANDSSNNCGNGDVQPLPSQLQLNGGGEEEWGKSLVGRWWEVFWGPSSQKIKSCDIDIDVENHKKSKGARSDHNRTEVDNSLNFGNEVTKSINQPIQVDIVPVPDPGGFHHQCRSNPIPAHPSTSDDQAMLDQPPNHSITTQQRVQKIDCIYTTPRLGLALAHHVDQVIVTGINSDAPNSELIKVMDVVVGINGLLFPPSKSTDDFNGVVTALRETERPVMVTFQRWVTPAVKDVEAAPATVTSITSDKIQTRAQIKAAASIESKLNSHHQLTGRNNYSSLTSPTSENDSFSSKPWPLSSYSSLAGKETSSRAPSPVDIDDIPLNILQQHRELHLAQHKTRQNQKRPRPSNSNQEKKLAGAGRNHINKTYQKWNDDNESDGDDSEEHVEDWYDAKILTLRNGNFVVRFLGDEEGVTYTMLLNPLIVRPSVRAWATRSLALINFFDFSEKNDDASCGKKVRLVEGFMRSGLNPESEPFSAWMTRVSSLLPQGTDFPEDAKHYALSCIANDNNDSVSGCAKKLMGFKYFLEMQLYLATRLSLAQGNGSDDEDDSKRCADSEEEDNDTPGPFVNAFYVKHLCGCLSTTKEACEWLITESAILSAVENLMSLANLNANWLSISSLNKEMHELNSIPPQRAPRNNADTKISKRAVRSCLLSGANFLHNLLSLNPSQETEKRPEVRKSMSRQNRRSARKRRRIDVDENNKNSSNNILSEGRITDASHELLFSEALRSNDALDTLLSGVLKKYSSKANKTFIKTTIATFLSILSERVWKPLNDWIEKADDMASGTSGIFYPLKDVEAQRSAAKTMSQLQFVDLSTWVCKLDAKLECSRTFEMEAWSAITACTQLSVVTAISSTGSGSPHAGEDLCLTALRRLKDKASPSAPNASALDYPMRNLDPLGNHLGAQSSLTRVVIDDAIAIRLWVLDLKQAKSVRERLSFVQGVIQQYASLPELPNPPCTLAGGCLDGVITSPSAALAENTKDSITILSANAFSYNHIIESFSTRLQNSMNINQEQSGSTKSARDLHCKAGVASVLAELGKLPVLSLVEEKFHVRNELIDWNEAVLQLMAALPARKPSLHHVEALYAKLSDILCGKTEARSRVVQNIRSNEFIDKEIRDFAVKDESVICSVSAPWVRGQFKAGSEWKAKCESVVADLRTHAYFEDQSTATLASGKDGTRVAVDLQRITELLEEPNDVDFRSTFLDHHAVLQKIRHQATEWSSNIEVVILSNSFTLEERRNRLLKARGERPRGISMDPSQHVIDLWIDALSWSLKLQHAMELFMERIMDSQESREHAPQFHDLKSNEFRDLFKSCMVPVLLEGKAFLLMSKECLPPFILDIKNEAFERLAEYYEKENVKSISIESLLNTSEHGKCLLGHMLDMDADKKTGSPLFFARLLFWRQMVICFFKHIQNDTSPHARESNSTNSVDTTITLEDAKVLLTICPRGAGDTIDSFAETNVIVRKIRIAEWGRLRNLINDANGLETRASLALSRCADLLGINYFKNRDDLSTSLTDMKNIQADFENGHFNLAAKLLRKSDFETRINKKVKGLSWLVSTFAFPILFDQSNSEVNRRFPQKTQEDTAADSNEFLNNLTPRIPMGALEDLQKKIPIMVGQHRSDSGDFLDDEVVKMSRVVDDLYVRADACQSTVLSLIPQSDPGLDAGDATFPEYPLVDMMSLEEIIQNPIVLKVIIPQISNVQKIIKMIRQMKEKLERELLCADYNGTDVDIFRFPDVKSLIGKNGDFLLYRLTGGQLYSSLREILQSIGKIASNISVTTPEKATFKWIVDVFEWVESVRNSVTDQCPLKCHPAQLVIKSTDASAILKNGQKVFYNISEEVKETLRMQKISVRLFAQKVSVIIMKGGTANSPGGSLLRWATFLFECIKADIERGEQWEKRALMLLDSFTKYESEGTISSIGSPSAFKNEVKNMIQEATTELIIQHDELLLSLDRLVEKVANSNQLKRHLELELAAKEEQRFLSEKVKFENSEHLVSDRFELLDSLMEIIPLRNPEKYKLFDRKQAELLLGESSVRDKSRVFLQNSLLKGMGMLGIDGTRVDARDFSALLAWDLENAIFEKFPSSFDQVSHEYREKVRSLRFNLSDPKNPMLCSRVLLGKIKIPDLIVMSSDALASREMKEIRQQVQEEAIKSVVISSGIASKKPAQMGITNQLAEKIKIESARTNFRLNHFMAKENHPGRGITSTKYDLISPGELKARGTAISDQPATSKKNISLPLSLPEEEKTIATSSQMLSTQPVKKENLVLSLEPPKIKNDHPSCIPSPTFLSRSFSEVDEDERGPSPLLSPRPDGISSHSSSSSASYNPQHLGHHITSKSGIDLFSITISRLKTSFTTKLFVEHSCQWEISGFLPSCLIEKGRISLDEFNKFISGKTKSGKWTLVRLKLSCITGESNLSSYKKYYKEYESNDRICMVSVTDDTKLFLVTPKFLRVCKCVSGARNLSRSSTYVVLLTKKQLVPKHKGSPAVQKEDRFFSSVEPPPLSC